MTKFFVTALLILQFFFLSAGWTTAGYWPVGLVLLVMIPLMLGIRQRNYISTLSLALLITVLGAALGVWIGISLIFGLTAVICALAAWDLDSFSRRLAQAAPEDNPLLIERRHILRVSLILLFAAIISLISQSIRLVFSFELAAVLAIFTFSAIGALVNWLRNKEN